MAAHLEEWTQWSPVMERFGGHMRNLPPGAVLWYEGLMGLWDQAPAVSVPLQQAFLPLQCHNYALIEYTPGQWAAALFGVMMPVWAALTPWALYAVLRQVSPVNARAVTLFYPLIPALSGFAGSWSTLYPLFVLLAFWALFRAVQRARIAWHWAVIAGLLSGVGVFFNFALVPLSLLFGFWVLIHEYWVKGYPFLRQVKVGLGYGLGLILPWVAFWVLSQETFFDLLQTSMGFHLDLDRPYWFWVGMHLWDWLIWGGLALGLVLIFNLVRGAKVWRSRSEIPALSVALALTLLVMLFSGTARGETGRVWLFFVPFLLIAVAESLSKAKAALSEREWLWLMAAQGVLTVVMVTSIASMSTDFTPPPDAPQVVTDQPAEARFHGEDGVFHLTGWSGQITGDALELRLQWQGEQHSTQPVWFGAVLVGNTGETVPVEAWQPGGEIRYPTTCWAEGTVMGDAISVPLDGYQSDEWWVSLSAYDAAGNAFTVTTPTGEDVQIGLGPILR